MSDRYLICLDIDATLIGVDMKISPRNLAALRQAITQGALVYLVTGRMLYSGRVIAKDIAPAVQVVGSNGAVVATENGVHSTGLSAQIAAELTKLSLDADFPLFLFGQQKVYYTKTPPAYMVGDAGNRVHSSDPNDYQRLAYDRLPDGPVANGIVIEESQPERLPAIRQRLADNFGARLQLSSSNVNNIELIPVGVDKGTAVAYLKQHYRIDDAHTVLFGDGANDVPMFSQGDYSVAMGNASETVKKAANFVTGDYREDGVARFLETQILPLMQRSEAQ